jgi:hypothetical protein
MVEIEAPPFPIFVPTQKRFHTTDFEINSTLDIKVYVYLIFMMSDYP